MALPRFSPDLIHYLAKLSVYFFSRSWLPLAWPMENPLRWQKYFSKSLSTHLPFPSFTLAHLKSDKSHNLFLLKLPNLQHRGPHLDQTPHQGYSLAHLGLLLPITGLLNCRTTTMQGQIILCCGRLCLYINGMYSTISGLCSPDTSSTLPPTCDTKICLQTLPNDP